MNLYKLLLIIILALKITCVSAQTNLENEIISSLIKSEFKKNNDDTVFNYKGKIQKIIKAEALKIILLNTTSPYLIDSTIFFEHEFDNFTVFDKNCYYDFIKKNETSIQIDTIKDFNGIIHYFSSEDISAVFENGGWDNYYKKFGLQEIVEVSRPGLNAEKNLAIIYYSSILDELGGSGIFVILQKIDNKWIVKDSWVVWMS